MGSQCDIASFVLRFKQQVRHDADGAPHVEWRGHIRHVQHDAEMCFTELHEAIEFMQDVLVSFGPALACAGGTDDEPNAAAGAVSMLAQDSNKSGQPPLTHIK
ncbi:MAG: hypothetical protein WDZ49_01740 [Litorilinea sp.]